MNVQFYAFTFSDILNDLDISLSGLQQAIFDLFGDFRFIVAYGELVAESHTGEMSVQSFSIPFPDPIFIAGFLIFTLCLYSCFRILFKAIFR